MCCDHLWGKGKNGKKIGMWQIEARKTEVLAAAVPSISYLIPYLISISDLPSWIHLNLHQQCGCCRSEVAFWVNGGLPMGKGHQGLQPPQNAACALVAWLHHTRHSIKQ